MGGQRPDWSLLANPYLRVYKALGSAKSLELLLQDVQNDSSGPKDSHLISVIKRIQYILKTGSRLFRTDSGAMGLSLKDKDRVDDLVVLIPGTSVPCVLRALDWGEITASSSQPSDCYQFVGVTYIQGIMNEEFFNKRKKKNNGTHTPRSIVYSSAKTVFHTNPAVQYISRTASRGHFSNAMNSNPGTDEHNRCFPDYMNEINETNENNVLGE